jgi:uncharacterized protein (TIGR00251 family)
MMNMGDDLRYQVEVEFHKYYVRVEGDKIFVGLKSRPERGEANVELIKKLAKYFGVRSSQVKIVSGWKSRTKIVEIESVGKKV